MASPLPSVTTADDLARLRDPYHRYDLIRGRLIQMSPAGGRHGRVAAKVAFLLNQYVLPCRLGTVFGAETGFFLAHGPDVVLGPDAAFVRASRLTPALDLDGFVDLAPDLVVEIVSPSQSRAEVDEKADEYLRAGVPLVWVLDPRRRTARVHRPGQPTRLLQEPEFLTGEDVLPGMQLPLAEIFD